VIPRLDATIRTGTPGVETRTPLGDAAIMAFDIPVTSPTPSVRRQARRTAAERECPGGAERDLSCPVGWLPVTDFAEGPAAKEHSALLLIL
jgi:hypothetical protein